MIEPRSGAVQRAAGWDAAALAALVVATALLAVASVTRLWDRDEPRFAQATVEMLHSGNFLVPTFNGKLRPDKPVLIYWLMSIPVRLFGPGEVALRSVSALGMAVAALVTYTVGRWLFPPRAALLALAMMVTTPLALVVGSGATTDAALLAFVSLAMAVFAHAFLLGWRALHGPLLAVAIGAALLTKGPVGLALPLASMVVVWWLGRSHTPLKAHHLAWVSVAVAGGLGIFLAWAIPANQATSGEFARAGLGHHVWQRIVSPLEGHGGALLVFLPYYFLVVLVAFFPWTLYVAGASRALIDGVLGGPQGRALLVGWLAPTLVVMTFVATKLPQYILPIWPPLALTAAATLDAALRGQLDGRQRFWLRCGSWLIVPGGLLLCLGLIALPFFFPVPGLQLPVVAAGAVCLGAAGLAVREHRAGRLHAGCAVLFGGAVLWELAVVAGVLPALDRLQLAPPIAAAIRAQTPPDVPLAVHHFGEPSLVFYVGRWPVSELGSDEQVVEWARAPEPGVLVLPRPSLEGIEARRGQLGLEVITDVRGFNFAKGDWVDLTVVLRRRRAPSSLRLDIPRALVVRKAEECRPPLRL